MSEIEFDYEMADLSQKMQIQDNAGFNKSGKLSSGSYDTDNY